MIHVEETSTWNTLTLCPLFILDTLLWNQRSNKSCGTSWWWIRPWIVKGTDCCAVVQVHAPCFVHTPNAEGTRCFGEKCLRTKPESPSLFWTFLRIQQIKLLLICLFSCDDELQASGRSCDSFSHHIFSCSFSVVINFWRTDSHATNHQKDCKHVLKTMQKSRSYSFIHGKNYFGLFYSLQQTNMIIFNKNLSINYFC